MARIEEKQKNAVYFCLDGLLEPLFVVRHSGECDKQLVQVTNGNGEAYSIPAPDDDVRMPCDGKKTVWLKVSCDPGRSMEALTVISQLIALQKSAKDLPTTSVVRVVGQ